MTRGRALALLGILTPLAAQSVLQIHVIEGEGVVYPTGGRATRGITVQVSDETGRPVPGAAVTFRLPDNGPSGEFPEGGKTAIQITGADGRALVWGMQWNREAGTVEIRITASKGDARAGAVSRVVLSDQPENGLPESGLGPAKSHKKLWIALGAVAATVGIVAAAANSGSSSATTVPPSAINAPRIGAPTITLGRP